MPRISEVPSSVLRDERVSSNGQVSVSDVVDDFDRSFLILSKKKGGSKGAGPNLKNVGGCHRSADVFASGFGVTEGSESVVRWEIGRSARSAITERERGYWREA